MSDNHEKYSALIKKLSNHQMTELEANEHKGDFDHWRPNRFELVKELNHHLSKLRVAIMNHRHEEITEYSADVANLCAKAIDLYGGGAPN